jgi:dipeptidyl aminopeptidase/acylaminoacyl peptidase
MRNLTLFSSFSLKGLWPAVVLALTAGIVLVPGAVAQGDNSRALTVVAAALNVRSGPGLSYPAFEVLLQGETATIIGSDAASGWWQVQLPDGATGWVSNGPAYVSVQNGGVALPSTADLSVTTDSAITSPAPSPSPQGTIVFQTASGGPIYAVNPDGTNLRYLTTGLDPVLSPDGRQLVFARWETSQDGALGSLWLINIDGTGERVIHENLFNPRAPVWSADGSKIVISMQHGGRPQPEETCGDRRPPREAYDIKVFREDGKIKFCYTLPADPFWGLRLIDLASGGHQDLPGDTYSLSPAWDPQDSGRLVYDGDRGLINLSLSDSKTWPLTADFNDRSPIFSPDGSKLAVSYRQDDHWEIHVMNADGSSRVRLTQTSYQTLVQQELNGQMPHSFNNAAPTWSPDGSQIAFLTDRTGQWEIWVMNADGSNQRPLFPPETLAGISLQYNGVDERMVSWR